MSNHLVNLSARLRGIADKLDSEPGQEAEAQHLVECARIVERLPCEHEPDTALFVNPPDVTRCRCRHCKTELKRVWVADDAEADPWPDIPGV